MRNLVFRILAVLIGCTAAFGLAEIAVRVICPQETGPPRFAFQPELGDIPVPKQKGRQRYPGVYDFTYTNNSLGFRGSKEFGPKQAGSKRILILGDSFAYGLGVNDDQTFASHLERRLRQNHINAEVINAGNPGKGTDYELKLFQTVGAQLQPDLTVLCFFPNDFQDNVRGEYFEVRPDGGLRVKRLGRGEGLKAFLFHFPGYSWLISWSQAANLVKQAAVNYLVKRQKDEGGKAAAASGLVVSYQTGFDGRGFADDHSRKLAGIYLAQLQEAVRRAGSDLTVFYLPLASEVQTYRPQQRVSGDEQALKALIEAQGGSLKSLTPVLAADPGAIPDLYYPEGHWTPRAHALVGRYLAGLITPGLQEKPGPR